MINLKYIIALFPFGKLKTLISNPAHRKVFLNEINFINFNRLKTLSYLLIVLVVIQLYSDFFLSRFWETHQIDYFTKLDLFLAGVVLTSILFTHIRPPVKPSGIKPLNNIVLKVLLVGCFIWITGISVIEAKTANSTPTYLLGVFTLAIVFLYRGLFFPIVLILSLIGLFTGLLKMGFSTDELVQKYSTIIALVVLAWVFSRILFRTRVKSFISTIRIEEARSKLDQKVKERTAKLSEANQKLLNEIKERKNYEKKLRQEKKRAEESDRLKSTFLANMSHEIRTPLNGIMGFSDLLSNPNLSQSKRERYINIVSSNSHQLLKLIDDIMDISMIESNQVSISKSKFSVGQIVDETVTFFNKYKETINKENISLIVENTIKETNDQIYSDSDRLKQILYNLLKNAFKFTAEGHIKINYRFNSEQILFIVEDTGIGVPEEKQKYIFERFRQGEETLARKYGGTGLGLSISKGLIQNLNGKIWLDTEYKDGARFCFTLPHVTEKQVETN